MALSVTPTDEMKTLTVGEKIYEIVDDQAREDVSEVKADLNQLNLNNVKRNLIGRNIGSFYPVNISKGDIITMSTSDGRNVPFDGGVKVYFFEADGTYVNYYTILKGTSERTVTIINTQPIRWICQDVSAETPIQVELGSVKTVYQEYDDSSDYADQIAENGFYEINSANQMCRGTFDSDGYKQYDGRLHSKNIYIPAHAGDRVILESNTHDILVGVASDPLQRGNSTYTSGWKRSLDTIINYDGYYVFLAKGTADTFNASYKVIPYWLVDSVEPATDIFDAEIDATIKSVRNVQTEPCLTFPVVTDIHRHTASVQTFGKMVENIRAVSSAVKCDFVANLGDTVEGNKTQATTLEDAQESNSALKNIGLPYLYAQGNHDNNPYITGGVFSIKQVYSGFYAFTNPQTINTAENGTDFYVDFPAIGVRVIVINSCNVNKATTYAYGDTTATWLANALNTDMKVILLEHLSSISSQVWSNNSPVNANAISSALTAFVNGGKTLIQLSGHSHVDLAFIEPWLSIMQVCQKFEQADISTTGYQAITGYIDSMGNPARTAGTYTEDAWSVCVYKPMSNTFHMIRFGAGVDRHFHVAPIAPTTVTSLLSGTLAWSTSNSEVATVTNGVITGVSSGKCAIIAKDESGNYECWIVNVA